MCDGDHAMVQPIGTIVVASTTVNRAAAARSQILYQQSTACARIVRMTTPSL
jgi:hypothetical protein